MTKVEEPEIELELEPIEAEKKEDEVVVEDSAPSVEDGIAELKAKLEEERSGRMAAEQRVREATEQVSTARTDVNDTRLHLINTAIETVRRNQDILKQNYRDALASGDYDAAANINDDMIQARSDLKDLTVGKQNHEYSMRQPVAPVVTHSDPVEAFASQLTPQSAAWIRAHPEFAKDETLKADMIDAHTAAMRRGIRADSNEYFAFVEKKLDVQSRQDEGEAMSAASTPTSRRSAPPAAPVSRSGTGTGGTRSNVVSLSRAERETARDLGMTDQEYARNKVALVKEGRM